MATVTANNITVFFDRYESLFQDGSVIYKDQFVHLRVTNNTGASIFINVVACSALINGSYEGNIPFDAGRTGGVLIEIPANAVEYPLIVEDNFAEGAYNQDLFFESGSEVRGQVFFQGLNTYPDTDFTALIDEVYKETNENTGYKGWTTLEEYYLDSGEPTGATKPNAPEDPDYVAPVYDINACPLP